MQRTKVTGIWLQGANGDGILVFERPKSHANHNEGVLFEQDESLVLRAHNGFDNISHEYIIDNVDNARHLMEELPDIVVQEATPDGETLRIDAEYVTENQTYRHSGLKP